MLKYSDIMKWRQENRGFTPVIYLSPAGYNELRYSSIEDLDPRYRKFYGYDFFVVCSDNHPDWRIARE